VAIPASTFLSASFHTLFVLNFVLVLVLRFPETLKRGTCETGRIGFCCHFDEHAELAGLRRSDLRKPRLTLSGGHRHHSGTDCSCRGADCLNAKQVAAVKRLMTPVTNSKGEVLYAYRYIPGTETQWAGWNYFGAPRAGYAPRIANLQVPVQHEKYLADEKIRDNVNALKYDFDREPATLARSRRIYDASSFDLTAFKARGGKILMWHGWADGAIMATSSIGYYEGVVKAMGSRRQTEDFFRLFLVPGVHRGGGGPGFTEFDSLTALENWVEKAQAPEKLITGQLSKGVVERTRPVFPYPVLARYSGKGDPKQADSFVPFDPSQH